LRNATAPIKSYPFDTSRKSDSRLKSKSFYVTGVNRTVSVEVHDHPEAGFTDGLHRGRVVSANGVGTRSFNVTGKLSRRIHEAHVIACASDTNDCEASYDHGDGNRDQQLNHAETIGVSGRLCSHNFCGRTFRYY
jgi:hypothetical protein